MPSKVAQVALSIPTNNLYSYLVPSHLEELLKKGHLVCVPLKNRETIGMVVEIIDFNPERCEETGQDIENDSETDTTLQKREIKEIIAIPYPEPIIDRRLLDLAKWISEYYICPIGITIRSLVPGGIIPEQIGDSNSKQNFHPRGKERIVVYASIAKPEEEIRMFIEANRKRAHRQCQVLEKLLKKRVDTPINDLFEDMPVQSSIVKNLSQKGLIVCSQKREFRDPYAGLGSSKEYKEVALTSDQQAAFDQMKDALDIGGFSTFLLHGITGSGKTEIYLRLVLEAVKRGIQSIILVPEISITHQFIDRFKFYLGSRIAIQHSNLSDGERMDEWLRIKNGLADVVIGARSAIFAPFDRLGVIICDEEHDASYKQGSQPKYHGRDVAIMRGRLTGCLVCLGSATPSLESYYNAQRGKYRLLTLPKRVTTHPLPLVNIIDMREEYDKGKEGHKDDISLKDMDTQDQRPQIIFSERLFKAVEGALKKGEQVLIFQNRRGHSPFLLCPKCGFVPKCPNCSVSLTYHHSDMAVRCHYCGFQKPPPDFCKDCKDVPLRYMGFGTQRIENDIMEQLPGFKVARMDRDTTSRKGAHNKILGRLERGEINILVGTQMITKGLDFPNITLVGVIGADYALHLPDFRATERVFQMITQVAGRAGRGDEPGRVMIQTFYPDHYSVFYASNHDYSSFYEREIGFRRRLMYPPFSRMVSIIIKGRDKKTTRKAANLFGKMIKVNIDPKLVRCLGPSMAPIFRIKNTYRYQMMLKARDYRIAHALIRDAMSQFSKEKDFSRCKIEVDVDPTNFL